ncbi:MAG TPA: response regulator transcription factor [Candidatus Paceibacterota bacterium]|jgi:DNA-binding response OmpR family regulator|nr:response regulator transcription factor [Candidatus Paceibacterota bacterium]HOH11140.1 response regulator transcription factor [Candidatus Paceibacterota bacterium]HOY11153.1 response regulator transcription factor [Candidatus Paceibacterota bacterium]HPI24710.1 response regulator transcription factor [Candidatus Paceibacterota bacterium]HPN89489.1 response regulator transcription factor [Candidatus Paceibacterota bacterium]
MKILIVEDEERLAKLIKKALEKEGFAADYVTDGEAAETRIEICHKDYDLVILDLMLPKKDGLEVCRSIRAKKINIPILVLTAKFDVDDKVKTLDAGADDYLVKPFSLEELVSRIRALLRRPPQTIPTVLKTQDLTLNNATRKVTRGNKEIKLTVKEFAILEYLMRNPNQVISRSQILDHLWGSDFDSFSNVIDVHVKNLRKKISNGSRRRIIETIRGIGYRISTE